QVLDDRRLHDPAAHRLPLPPAPLHQGRHPRRSEELTPAPLARPHPLYPTCTASPLRRSTPMLFRRLSTLSSTALGLTMLGAAGCSRPSERTTEDLSADVGLTDSGLPIVTDELTLTFGGAKSPLAPEYEAMELVQTW